MRCASGSTPVNDAGLDALLKRFKEEAPVERLVDDVDLVTCLVKQLDDELEARQCAWDVFRGFLPLCASVATPSWPTGAEAAHASLMGRPLELIDDPELMRDSKIGSSLRGRCARLLRKGKRIESAAAIVETLLTDVARGALSEMTLAEARAKIINQVRRFEKRVASRIKHGEPVDIEPPPHVLLVDEIDAEILAEVRRHLEVHVFEMGRFGDDRIAGAQRCAGGDVLESSSDRGPRRFGSRVGGSAVTYLFERPTLLQEPLVLPKFDGRDRAVHLFTEEETVAVDAALAAGRPLLVRGEPGTGKTQLARAVAVGLGRHFVSKTLDAQTEAQSLFWAHDPVRRLSEAQLIGPLLAAKAALRNSGDDTVLEEGQTELARILDERRFVSPGVLWWAYDRQGALGQRKREGGELPAPAPWVTDAAAGSVVLLDEIDKADPIVPNALLEALGMGRFTVPGFSTAVERQSPAPLVIITSNEERVLPDAFVRRCLVYTIQLPAGEDLVAFLVERGQAHMDAEPVLGTCVPPSVDLLEQAARALVNERAYFKRQNLPKPGQAEYLDLLRVLCNQTDDEEKRVTLLTKVAPYILKKHSPVHRLDQ